ncbi:Golgi transport complex subunit 4 [Malassezia caprae]|uniref:Conserved oligomeric Golgi complex subunit 4 n=1 Tax=Malassezia caprae TaxID=1381934 RepID=A0AAF0E641_9BASI|nr:Golgi transport complex subunit 4 [Malassezia caprae]
MDTAAEGVRSALAELDAAQHAREKRCHATMDEARHHMVGMRSHIDAHILPVLQAASTQAQALGQRCEPAANIARALYSDIYALHEEKKRIECAIDWCTEAIVLRTSLAGLADALDRLDWDACIEHCRAALGVRKSVLHCDFSKTVVPSIMFPEAPAETLQTLHSRLVHKITRHFEHYTEERNEQEATRFLGYFAAVDAHWDGLRTYSALACSLLEAHQRELHERLASPTASPMFYATVWTALFEHLAVFISKHQPVVDRLLSGPGHPDFAAGVLPELARIWTALGHDILVAWRQHRQVPHLLAQAQDMHLAVIDRIRATPFVPGRIFGDDPRPSGRASPAPRAATPVTSTASSMPAVESLLTERASMGAQWALFSQFLQRSMGIKAADEQAAPLDEMLQSCWRTEFLPLQLFALRASIQQVHKLDVPDLQARPYGSSLPDDMFFALRTVWMRALSTSSLYVAEELFTQALQLLESDYVEIIVLRMDACRRTLNLAGLVEGPRRLAAAREVRAVMCVYLNALDVSAMYAERLLADMSHPSVLEPYFDAESRDNLPSDLARAQNTVALLDGLVTKLRSAISFEVQELFATLVETRLRSIVNESMRDVRYMLDEESYAQASEDAGLPGRVSSAWELLIHAYREPLTESNYALLFNAAADVLVQEWERTIASLTFTELGALRFDKDLRSILGFMADHTPWGIRDKFLRLQQISYVLNMDDEELETMDVYEAALSH